MLTMLWKKMNLPRCLMHLRQLPYFPLYRLAALYFCFRLPSLQVTGNPKSVLHCRCYQIGLTLALVSFDFLERCWSNLLIFTDCSLIQPLWH